MVVCRVAHRLSHSSPCHRVHPLGCLSRDDEITSHPSGIRLSVVVGSGIIIRFACPVSLQVLARYLTSQSALALTSLALSLSVGKVERCLAAWALYFPEAGVSDAAYGFYFHMRRYSKKIHCFVRVNSFHILARQKDARRRIGDLRRAVFVPRTCSPDCRMLGFYRCGIRCPFIRLS